MKFKDGGAQFLLLILAVYFLCPLLCAAHQGLSCVGKAVEPVSVYRRSLTSPTEVGVGRSACCHPENEASTPLESREGKDADCCITRFVLLNPAQQNLFSQAREESFSFIALIPEDPALPSRPTASAFSIQSSPPFYKAPSRYQTSPRAPPFLFA
jgi:hypothetical protein